MCASRKIGFLNRAAEPFVFNSRRHQPPLRQLPLTADDLAHLQPLSPIWLGKSQQTALAYETILEFVAEQTHSSPAFITRLNPSIDWTSVQADMIVSVPDVDLDAPLAKPAMLHFRLAEHVLEARDDAGELIAHFTVPELLGGALILAGTVAPALQNEKPRAPTRV